MTRAAAAVAFAAALALSGCGETCVSKPADVKDFAAAECSVPANQPVTFRAQGACQQCSESSPSCSGTVNAAGGTSFIELDTRYQECEADRGCAGTSCAQPPPVFDCGVQGLPAGDYVVIGKTETGTTQAVVHSQPASGSAFCAL